MATVDSTQSPSNPPAQRDSALLANPLLGHTAQETFGKIETVLQFLSMATDPSKGVMDKYAMPGLNNIVNVLWATAQFERDRGAVAGVSHP